jgi:polynucleotide 5'-hydroxyl-kinase GRC3/NOL9
VALDIPESWRPALDRLSREGGLCFVLGATDSGKSCFCAVAANHLLASGSVAVVDADTGQSDIGPPACVSVGLVSQCVDRLGDVPAAASHFVGATSPYGHLLQAAAGARRMADRARDLGARAILVDTTGMVAGSAARAFKAAKIDLLDPDWLVALQHEDEVEHLLAPYRRRRRPQVIRLRASRAVQTRNADERRSNRQRGFAAALARAQPAVVPWASLGAEGTPFLTGEPLPGHLRDQLEEIAGSEVRHAERCADLTFAVARGGAPSRRRGEPIEIADEAAFDHRLVGLLDEAGETIALGLLTAVDWAAQTLTLHARADAAARTRAIRLGALRVAEDGTELGRA